MKKVGLLAILLLVASNAGATTFHIRYGAGGTGSSYGDACSIHRFNTDARPGDKGFIYPSGGNTYPEPIAPDSANSNPSGFITVVGAALEGDPLLVPSIRSTIRVPGSLFLKSKVVIKGVKYVGSLEVMYPSDTDSL